LFDAFGTGAAHKAPLPLSLESCPYWFEYSETTGVDIGFLQLPQLIKDGLRANGVRPMANLDWWHQEGVEFEAHAVCGLPQENVTSLERGYTLTNAFFPIVEELNPPESIKKTFPRFYARVPELAEFDSIKGMSGGPIFAFKRTPEGLRYWIYALLCGWDPNKRVLAACPATLFGPVIEQLSQGNWVWKTWPN
jgi:hypothetical protein